MMQMDTVIDPQTFGGGLSDDEIARLLDPQEGHAARFAVGKRMASRYAARPLRSSHDPMSEQVFRLLVRDPQLPVRIMLSTTLCRTRSLPRDIVLAMIRDAQEVSTPVLLHSPALQEEDAMELLAMRTKAREEWCAEAMAQRSVVTERVSAYILHYSQAAAVIHLLNNRGASISAMHFKHVAERFVHEQNVRAALAERLQMVGHHHVPEVRADDSKALAELAELDDAKAIERFAQHLASVNRLSPALLLAALGKGYVYFFEAGMATLARITHESACALMYDRGMLGFRALYNKSCLPSALFAPTRALLQAVMEVQDKRSFSADAWVETLLAQAEGPAVANLEYVLALLRSDSRHAA